MNTLATHAPHDEANAPDNSVVALGFWIFLLSDLVLFLLLLTSYLALLPNTGSGPGPTALFDLSRTALQTGALLLSSLTCGLATLALGEARRRALLGWLIATALFGVAFIGLELAEFSGLLARGAAPQASGFLSAYWLLVSTHGVHVSAGLVWIVVLAAQIGLRGLTPRIVSRFTRFALFWHMLDVVWIGIYSFVYLYGSLP